MPLNQVPSTYKMLSVFDARLFQIIISILPPSIILDINNHCLILRILIGPHTQHRDIHTINPVQYGGGFGDVGPHSEPQGVVT